MDPNCFGFRLASWNANGIKSRIVEVRDFIDKHHPDVFLIQESHLGPGDSIHFPNYTVYRTDRPHTTNTRPRGGTAILLKSSLPHHHTPTPPMGTVEATSVTLTPPGGDPLVITSLYISPSVSYQHIHTDVEALFRLGGASIICGDFNAHHISWGCQSNDNRGNIIKNLIDNTDTQIVAPTTPTRFGHNSASIIDFALTRNIHWLSQVESIAELSSDHNPLIISFDTNRRFAFPRRIVTTDWAAFRELLIHSNKSRFPHQTRTSTPLLRPTTTSSSTSLQSANQVAACLPSRFLPLPQATLTLRSGTEERSAFHEAISPLNAPSQPRPRLSVPIAADRTLQTSPGCPKNPINTKTTKSKAAKNVWKERAAARKQNTNQSKPSFAEVVKGTKNNSLDAKEVMTKMAQMMSQWGEMLSLLQSKL
ncbi:probable RNA-directed DNA polymerase from transposon X-element [Trichonephila clavipes]|nr:probable RNA-directed DNA polymerase from transposon X-element [Trichonephila clavipes]